MKKVRDRGWGRGDGAGGEWRVPFAQTAPRPDRGRLDEPGCEELGYAPVTVERVRNELIPKELKSARCGKECIIFCKERT